MREQGTYKIVYVVIMHAYATAVKKCYQISTTEKTTGRQRSSTTFLGCSLMASIALDLITQTAVNDGELVPVLV